MDEEEQREIDRQREQIVNDRSASSSALLDYECQRVCSVSGRHLDCHTGEGVNSEVIRSSSCNIEVLSHL
jgi:hypothetical protein